jgi:hypothetical protein
MLRRVLQCVSWMALVATLVPSLLYLAGRCDLVQCSTWMLLATLIWFAVTPFWMGRRNNG